MTRATEARRLFGPDGLLNTHHHKAVLVIFLFVLIAHWAEHLAQAYQIYVLGWPRPQAGGVLGLAFPVLPARMSASAPGFSPVVMLASTPPPPAAPEEAGC